MKLLTWALAVSISSLCHANTKIYTHFESREIKDFVHSEPGPNDKLCYDLEPPDRRVIEDLGFIYVDRQWWGTKNECKNFKPDVLEHQKRIWPRAARMKFTLPLPNLWAAHLGDAMVFEAPLFAHAPNLEAIIFEHFHPFSFPDGFWAGLPKLKFLHLIEALNLIFDEKTFQGLSSVEYLDIANAPALNIVNGAIFRPLVSLKVLRLGGNPLVHIAADAFEGLEQLETVDLSFPEVTGRRIPVMLRQEEWPNVLWLDKKAVDRLSKLKNFKTLNLNGRIITKSQADYARLTLGSKVQMWDELTQSDLEQDGPETFIYDQCKAHMENLSAYISKQPLPFPNLINFGQHREYVYKIEDLGYGDVKFHRFDLWKLFTDPEMFSKTALRMAAFCGDVKMSHELLTRNLVDSLVKDPLPFEIALHHGSLELIEFFASKVAPVELKKAWPHILGVRPGIKWASNPYHLIVPNSIREARWIAKVSYLNVITPQRDYKSLEVAKMMVRLGVNVKERTWPDLPEPIALANNYEHVEFLINNGADPDFVSEIVMSKDVGPSALYNAAARCDLKTVDFLKTKSKLRKSMIGRTKYYGVWSPLRVAFENNCREVARRLWSWGARE